MTDVTKLSMATWRKSSFSNGGGECVEVAGLTGGRVAARDSKAPDVGVLRVPAGSWAAFVERLR